MFRWKLWTFGKDFSLWKKNSRFIWNVSSEEIWWVTLELEFWRILFKQIDIYKRFISIEIFFFWIISKTWSTHSKSNEENDSLMIIFLFLFSATQQFNTFLFQSPISFWWKLRKKIEWKKFKIWLVAFVFLLFRFFCRSILKFFFQLDTICTRNQQYSTPVVPDDCLILSTAANLTREMNLSWEYQQQLIGHQASLDYIFSCSNRLVNNVVPATNHDEVNSLLSRTSRISKVSWKVMNRLNVLFRFSAFVTTLFGLHGRRRNVKRTMESSLFKFSRKTSRKKWTSIEKILSIVQRTNDNQLWRCKTNWSCLLLNDIFFIFIQQKFQEQLRNYFSQSNENIDRLLTKEFPIRLNNQTRQCYINVATCLQKRAYDVTNDIAADLHKQMVRCHSLIPSVDVYSIVLL